MDIPTHHARTCKGCSSDVAFIKCTRKGRTKTEVTWVPVDFKATDVGTYWVEADPGSDRPALRGGHVEKRGMREGMRASGVALHTDHRKTCPKADEFKRHRKSLF